ncbi:MAG: hypothetical protein V1846_02505 [Candidatus Komeilibacteria bacterium]
MIARIAPLRRLPANLDYFDYSIPDSLLPDIRPGSVVRIPFRHQHLTGVVLDIVPTSDQTHLEPITALTPTELTRQQIELLKYLAVLYHLAPSTLLPFFLASEPKKNCTLDKSEELSRQYSGTVNSAFHSWVIYDDWKTLEQYCQPATNSHGGQTLIVIPEYYLLPLAKKIVQDQPTIVLPAKQEKYAYWRAWNQARSAPIIIGTFPSLFLPFTKLQQLIILDAENTQFHRSEHNPRIHLADWLSHYQRLYDCQLLLASPSPCSRLFQTTRNTALPVKSIERKSARLLTIDMTSERNSGSRGLLSQNALAAIDDSQRTLLYLNHYGTANMVACGRCQWLAQCDHCQRALSFNAGAKDLECWNCRQHQPAVGNCPQCGSAKLKLRSSGLSRLVREVTDIWPQKKIALLSQRLTSTVTPAEVVIATSKVLSTDLTFDTAIAVQPDNELWRPDFIATEELRRHLRQLLVRSQNLIIQTSNPSHYVYQSLANFKAYISEELAFRQEFNYPPFADSYKIFIKDKPKAASISAELVTRIGSQSETVIVTQEPYFLVTRGSLSSGFIDNLIKTYNNRILIEINPYQWN